MSTVGIVSQRGGRVTLALKGNLYAEMLPEITRRSIRTGPWRKRSIWT